MKKNLYILWTNSDKATAVNMLMMYAKNSILKMWWDRVTIIIWGGSQLLVCNDAEIQEEVKEAQELGVYFSACIACARNQGTIDKLRDLGVEVVSWGDKLTRLIQSGEYLLTI